MRLKVIVAWQAEDGEVTCLSGYAYVEHQQTMERVDASGFGSRFRNQLPGLTSAKTIVDWVGTPFEGKRDFSDIHEEVEGRRAVEPERRGIGPVASALPQRRSLG